MLLSHLLLILLFIITGCESNFLDSSNPSRTGMDKLAGNGDNLETLDTVTYLAVLNPLNSVIAGEAYGSFTFHKDHDFIVANVRLSNSSPIITLTQKVHLGNACPTEADDTNHDGYIDVLEAGKVSGNVIIPLDGDISGQYALLGNYPISDAWGAYVYSQTASFTQFYQDLYDLDVNPDDEVVKMTSPLGLIGKTVLIYGTDDHVELPETIAANNGLTPNQSLPVACGVITLVTEIPGIFEPDDMTIGHVPAPTSQPSHPNSYPRPERPVTTRPANPHDGIECIGDVGKGCGRF